MTQTNVAIVAGDREQPGLARVWAAHHRVLGYKVFIASSWPEDRLAEVYGGVTVDGLCSVDALLPYNPADGHGHRQLHRRIALAVRLGGMALAFADPAVDTVVLADTDVQMLVTPQIVAELVTQTDAFALKLPFKRPEEARYGWVCDLGLVIHRRGFDKLCRHLPWAVKSVLYDCGDAATVHGLLGGMLGLCRVDMATETLGGTYVLPNGMWPARLAPDMPADAWLNFGHLVHMHGGTPYFAHLCMKTKVDVGLSDPDTYTWAVRYLLADLCDLPWQGSVTEADMDVDDHWNAAVGHALETFGKANIATPERFYWQDYGAIVRHAAHLEAHGSLPERKTPLPPGVVTEVGVETIQRILRLQTA